MGRDTAELAELRSELSRTIAHRTALQERLAAVEGERNLLRADNGKLRDEVRRTHAELERMVVRCADLHGALNATKAKIDRVEAALAAPLGAETAASETAVPAPADPAPLQAPEPTAAPAPETAPEPTAATAPEPVAEPAPPEPSRLRALPTPAVVEVRNLRKTYRVPAQPVDTLKERILHPFRSRRASFVEALRDVSFDVHRGEFLGIVGANGCGKSTLLKILANVYAADSGTVRTAGRVAPFIELGVGLKPEFTARDNVVIGGVMMGLDPDEARARYEAVMDFAGLWDFTQLKLKNYSSGMQVRLAFSIMAQVDADILLIDEVLAVGDAEFRARCLARMKKLRSEGKTIVLVTHSMETIARECDRAIFLRDGVILAEGDPGEVARRYTTELTGAPAASAPAAELAAGQAES